MYRCVAEGAILNSYSRHVLSKCIVVEDDPFWSAEISAALSHANVQILNAQDGRQALDLASRYPDASMVLDLILPEVDGVEVLQKLSEVAPLMRVLAVTGGGRLGAGFYLKLASTFGAKAQLAKPFTAQQLIDNWTALAA
ncbi:MAG: hypothetical protein CL683_07315 [Brevundimonas sp.]|jgi:DNA-binding response OmpR family regulator|nr:hypothetical protein [Brevundimonas sp.]HAJ04170.1 hypothetical protein [Brevundimonas sp.]